MTDPREALQRLPAVDRTLQTPEAAELTDRYGHAWVVAAIREELDEQRARIRAGEPSIDLSELVGRVRQRLAEQGTPSLQGVINASGVIVHTNLGRAPLSTAAATAAAEIAAGYSNLEYDLPAGKRGSRYVHARELLTRLTGAEAALLVNNNAAAVLLALAGLAAGREVIISRGQLVEIGGGFRIPDVLAASGAQLVEVGTTNRTYAADYERAITPDTALILRVHQSNFRQQGFVHQAELAELAELAHAHGLVLVDDLGSGTLLDTAPYGLVHEPTVQESLAAGADLVTFSGDKLLGGPQAGILVGKAELIARLEHNPLTRALRVDKMAIAAMQATLLHYVRGEAERKIPVWRMLAASAVELEARSERLASSVGAAGWQLREGRSMIGGGALPEESLPTRLLVWPYANPQVLAERLRAGSPTVLARVEDGALVLDLRTVLPEQESALADRLRALLG
ncbi:MAG: L-seryl-tRNA(Sec) selenium transferase [Chloroflexi bacterium]|nr:L-seryl-tRNA(Sec) selenium transferase [Chloroflexota bacterium]